MDLNLNDLLPSEGYYALFEEVVGNFTSDQIFNLYAEYANSGDDYWTKVSGATYGE